MTNAAKTLLAAIAAEVKPTNEAERNACFSIAIKGLVDAGLPLEAAYDAIMGEGAYCQLSDDIWAHHNGVAA